MIQRNCVHGIQGNRHYFLIFLWVELAAMLLGAGVAAMRLNAALSSPASGDVVPWAALFLLVDVVVGISVAALAVTQVSSVESLHLCVPPHWS